MRLWRRPLCFTLKPGTESVCWEVATSNGVEHVALGEARRQKRRGSRRGTIIVWEPWPPAAEKPLTPAADSLQEAGERLLAARARREEAWRVESGP